METRWHIIQSRTDVQLIAKQIRPPFDGHEAISLTTAAGSSAISIHLDVSAMFANTSGGLTKPLIYLAGIGPIMTADEVLRIGIFQSSQVSQMYNVY